MNEDTLKDMRSNYRSYRRMGKEKVMNLREGKLEKKAALEQMGNKPRERREYACSDFWSGRHE